MNLENSLEPIPANTLVSTEVPSDKPRQLTRKQRLFVHYYMRGNNAAKSARLAGFADSVADNATIELVRHSAVAAEISRLSSKILKEMEVTTDQIVQETALMATSNLADFTEVGDDGKTISANLKGLSREQWACIQELSYDNNGKLKVKLYDKKSAIELYGRFKKIGLEEIQNKNGLDGQPLTVQSLDAIVKKSLTINQTINNYTITENTNRPATKELTGSGSQSTIEGHTSQL